MCIVLGTGARGIHRHETFLTNAKKDGCLACNIMCVCVFKENVIVSIPFLLMFTFDRVLPTFFHNIQSSSHLLL
jgi:hypothetical protein